MDPRRALTSGDDHEQFQRTAALARMSALLAAHDSLESVLSAMAHEIQRVDAIAGAQIILVEADGTMQMMGSAAFGEYEDFFDRLMACHRKGAPLATYAALELGKQQILRKRKATMLADERWGPLHSYISEIEWSHFISTPFSLQGRTRGVINCYVATSADITPALEWFLEAIAEQAALAVDYHGLMERDRSRVRRDERERIARDLHDSVIQSLFSISMHARALEELAKRPSIDALAITDLSLDLQKLAKTAQRDLRGVVRALRPSVVAELGFERALRGFAADTNRRAAIDVSLNLELDGPVDPDLADDAYLIAIEAIHNAIQHAQAKHVVLALTADRDGRLEIVARDDGRGFPGTTPPRGFGLASMQHRAERWGGSLEIESDVAHGTMIRAHLFSAGTGTR